MDPQGSNERIVRLEAPARTAQSIPPIAQPFGFFYSG